MILLLSFIRGLFEYFFDKNVAYVMQIFPILMGYLFLKNRMTRRNLKLSYRTLTLNILFVFGVLLSITSTVLINGEFGPVTLGMFLFTLAIADLSKLLINNNIQVDYEIFKKLSNLFVFLLVGVSILQQLDVFPIDLPGGTVPFLLVRPQSLTGSFLHYPLVVAIFSLIFFGNYLLARKRSDLLYFIFCMLSTFASFSRNGMFIIISGIFLILLNSEIKRVTKTYIGVLILLVVSTLLSIFPEIFDRLISSFSEDSEGNSVRLQVWQLAFEMINPFFGNFFGLLSNSYRGDHAYFISVPESGVLLMFLNVGIIFSLIYYYLIIKNYFDFPSNIRKIIIPIALSALGSTFFYQSIEVIPFIVVYLFVPIYFVEYTTGKDSLYRKAINVEVNNTGR